MEILNLLLRLAPNGQHYKSCSLFAGLLLWSGLSLLAFLGTAAYTQNFRDHSFIARQSAPSDDPELAKDEALIRHGDYGSADNSIRIYLSSHTDSADGHFLLGYVLYREDKPKDSLAEYTRGAHFRKPDANVLAIVAMDYVLLQDYADADKWLNKATQWQPENALYWYYLGRTKYSENRFQEAIQAFTKCLTLHPRDVRAEYNLGLSYAGLGRNDAAMTAYKNAITWQQNAKQQDPQPYLDLGILLAEEGRPEQAVPQLQKATDIDPKNPRSHEELGRVQQQLHQLTIAQMELEAAVSLAPNIPSLHFELGRIYQEEGMRVRAKKEFARCAVLNGTHSTDSAETPNTDFHR